MRSARAYAVAAMLVIGALLGAVSLAWEIQVPIPQGVARRSPNPSPPGVVAESKHHRGSRRPF